MKAGWKKCVSVPRAQPGLHGRSRHGRVEEESIHVHITAQLVSSGSALHEHLRRWQGGQLDVAQTKVSEPPWQSGFRPELQHGCLGD